MRCRNVDALQLEQHRRFGRACPAFRVSLAQHSMATVFNEHMPGLALNERCLAVSVYVHGGDHFSDKMRST